MRTALFLVLSLFICISANAQITINGTMVNESTITTNGDWVNNGTYSGDGVVSFVDGDQRIDMNDGTFSVLSIAGGGVKTLASNVNISGTLELIQGVIRVSGGASDLIILSNATISGGSPTSYVDGALFIDLIGRSSIDYPIGENDTYLPITLDNIDASGVIGYEAIGQELNSDDNFETVAPRHWERIVLNNGTFNSADVTLPVLGDEGFEDNDNVTVVETNAKTNNVTPVLSAFSGGNTISTLEPIVETFVSIGEIGIPLIVMNVVTPNADLQNDFLYIQNIELFPDNEVKIINRWGIEVFNQPNYDNTEIRWNGDVDGKIAPPGNYIVVIKTDRKVIKQTVSVIR